MARQTPYLTSLGSGPSQNVSAMEWAKYLGYTFGPDGAVDALAYYERINWITPNVRRTMTDYLRGISLEDVEEEDFNPTIPDSLQRLEGTPFEDHIPSLAYIATLAGDSIDRDLATLQLTDSDTPAAPLE